jgi:biotin synthase
MDKNQIQQIKDRILQGGTITKEEAIRLVETNNQEYFYECANEIREHFKGNVFDVCSIENAKSGACSEDCKWCSQSAHNNSDVEVYEMVDKKVAVEMAKKNEAYGVKRYSLVTSGRGVSNKNLKALVGVYEEIKKESNISLCASMGLLTQAQLEQLKEVGVEHYHCNLETSRRYFPEVCSTHTYDQKIETIKMAQDLGVKICSGGIIGMGEHMEDRLDMAFDLAKLGVQSIPINILNPIEGTPLGKAEELSEQEVLSTIAVFRFINPKANLRFAGGRNMMKDYQHKALKAGISSAVVGDLLTTTGSSGVEEDLSNFRAAGFEIPKK